MNFKTSLYLCELDKENSIQCLSFQATYLCMKIILLDTGQEILFLTRIEITKNQFALQIEI